MAQTRRFRGGKSMHRTGLRRTGMRKTGGRRTKSMRGGAGYNIYLEDGTPYLHFRTNSRFSSNDMSVEKLLEKLNFGQGERADTSTNETITGLRLIEKIREDESAAEQGQNAANYYTANMLVRPDHRSRDSNRNNVIIVRHKNQNEARRIFNEQSGIARRDAISTNRGQLLANRDRSDGGIQNNLQPGEGSGNRLRRNLQTYRGTARPLPTPSYSPPPYLSDVDSGAYGESGEGRKKKKEKKSRKKKKKKHKKKKKGGSLTHRRR